MRRFERSALVLVAGLLALLIPLSARAQVRIAWKKDVILGPFAVDHAGDVVGVGPLHKLEDRFSVAKLAGATGKVLWSVVLRTKDTGSWGDVSAVAIGPSNEVFVAGFLWGQTTKHPQLDQKLVVAKLTSAGKMVWTSSFGKAQRQTNPSDMAVDPRGDLIVIAGDKRVSDTPSDGIESEYVLKLEGASGNILWKEETDFPDAHRGPTGTGPLKVGPNGDVVLFNSPGAPTRKLSGRTGAQLWASSIWASAVAVTDQGEIVTTVGFGVAKLAGDGHVIWQTRGCHDGYSEYIALLDGDIFVVGGCSSDNNELVARFDGATGSMRWQRQTPRILRIKKTNPVAVSSQRPYVNGLLPIAHAVVVALDSKSPLVAMGVDPADGHTLWEAKDPSVTEWFTDRIGVHGTSVYISNEIGKVPSRDRLALIKLDVPCGVGADVKTDKAHCGACDHRCPDNDLCVAGICRDPNQPEPECICRDGTRYRVSETACEHICRGHDRPHGEHTSSAN
jgi:hypothetical protein